MKDGYWRKSKGLTTEATVTATSTGMEHNY
jgi:hypothetical protein